MLAFSGGKLVGIFGCNTLHVYLFVCLSIFNVSSVSFTYLKKSAVNIKNFFCIYLISYLYFYGNLIYWSIGVYTLAAVIAKLQGDTATATAMVAEVQTIFDSAVSDSNCLYDDFDAGRAGLIYAASFLSRYFGGYRHEDVITRSSLVAVGQAVVRRGKAVSSHPDEYLEWNNPNDGGKWLGQSHGSAGT
jgi:hypothetical protein